MSVVDEEDYRPQYFTREEALAIAHKEASRNLNEAAAAISYVAYLPEAYDHCSVEFIHESEGWVKTWRCLLPQERLGGEEIDDRTIHLLATRGNLVDAIRLYRAKHRVGLLDAKNAIEALLRR